MLRRSHLRNLASDRVKKLSAMVTFAIIVILLNWFPAIEHSVCENARHRFLKIESGKIRGHLAEDGNYLSFLGIPYAAPPIGNNRFKAPKPPQPWKGVYDAVRRVKCPQNGAGDEDCLILNVFTPRQPTSAPLPVLVYIHGGSFLMGSGPTKGMGPLIKQNLIVVTINYRLGVLGFLCLGIKDAPGNAGLKDQVAALRWVKRNIGFFGGNPNEVTIYGMSAGGASVEYLVLSKATKGLFSKAIVESASATSVWAADPTPIRTARKLAQLLELPERIHSEAMVVYYRTIPLDFLTEINYHYYNNLTDGSFGFVPCIERKIRKVKRLVTESAHTKLQNGNFDRVPMMFFFSSLEGLYLRSAEYTLNRYKEKMERNFLDFLPADLIFDKERFRNKTAENVRRFYFGNGTIGLMDYLNYFGDCLILHGLLYSVEGHALRSNPVYLMEFAYKGGLGGREKSYENINMAGHGDVVKYAILNKEPEAEHDIITVRRVTSLISNFVKYSNPIPVTTSLLPVTWPRVKPGNISYLQLGRELRPARNPREPWISFWDKLYARFRRPNNPVKPYYA